MQKPRNAKQRSEKVRDEQLRNEKQMNTNEEIEQAITELNNGTFIRQ